MKKMKAVKAWVGIVDGAPYLNIATDDYGQYDRLHVFMVKRAARRRFTEVAQVEIREVTKRRAK